MKIELKLLTEKDKVDFVRTAEKVDYEIDLSSGSSVVDAKSIMGVLSLPTGGKVVGTFYCKNGLEDDVKAVFKEWIV